nr:hypothetical protein [Klebsiella quasipneumoniae]
MSATNRITQTDGTAWSIQDKETYDPNDDLENYAEAAQAPINVIIFGKKVPLIQIRKTVSGKPPRLLQPSGNHPAEAGRVCQP